MRALGVEGPCGRGRAGCCAVPVCSMGVVWEGLAGALGGRGLEAGGTCFVTCLDKYLFCYLPDK